MNVNGENENYKLVRDVVVEVRNHEDLEKIIDLIKRARNNVSQPFFVEIWTKAPLPLKRTAQ